MKMIRFCRVTAAILIVVMTSGISDVMATTITIQNNDGVNEGFNDPTPVSPVTGNPGTTQGEQRLNVFKAAAKYWASKLDSNVEIIVSAEMDSLPCDEFSATLGAAGPMTTSLNFPGAPLTNTLYPAALANSLAGFDLNSGIADISATFNSDIDDANCLGNKTWSYVIGASPSADTIDLYHIVLHELAHGLGFLTFVDQAGHKLGDIDDHFMQFLHDQETGKDWVDMTDDERAISSVNDTRLVWNGQQANDESAFLTSGTSGGKLRMYAPGSFEEGSSVSHWDWSLEPNELLEPAASKINENWLSIKAFYDMGWQGNPCLKTTLPTNKWTMISLECLPPTGKKTIGDLFDDDMTGIYGEDWVVFGYDSTNNSYTSLRLTDALTVGKGYWIVQLSGASISLDIPRESHRTPVVKSAACTSDRGCFEAALVTKNNVFNWNMIGNPFLKGVGFDALRIVTNSGKCQTGCTPNEAKAANIVDNKILTFNASSPSYISIGNGNTWPARAGVWIPTLKQAHGLNPRLLIPLD